MRKGNHIHTWRLLVALVLLGFGSLALAKSPELEPLDSEGKRSWIIEFSDPPLVRFDGSNAVEARANTLEATSPRITNRRLDLLSPHARAYSTYLEDRFDHFLQRTQQAIGESSEVRARYKNLLNGAALRLTESQARLIEGLPGVKSVVPNEILRLETDAGPELIGAATIWNGEAGNIPSQGEGIVIGIVDTGINWDHPSFQDTTLDGYTHSNPLGAQLGLCGDAEVLCNNKLIGVYDFTDEGSKGKDTNFHGSHVASITAGNPLRVTVNGERTQISGVAPRANIVSYKVCVEDDPETPDEDEEGCSGVDVIEGLERALTDGIDVVNQSLGSDFAAVSPWGSSRYDLLFLDLRNAGMFAATSAGNAGPAPDSVSNPAVAPWLMAVAAATHSRASGSVLTDLSGGSTEPPGELAGAGSTPVNGSADGVGPAEIVWAGDYGNALCGIGESEGFSSCSSFTGASNPFSPGTFDGKIVVCERGDYGRVEKGFNVMQAGAVGYVLVNNLENGESTSTDSHCVPGIHIGYIRGQDLKSWLTSGSGHLATIGPFGLTYTVDVADILASFSSQGPSPAAPGVLKPNITAPGIDVLGAGKTGTTYVRVNGTSQSSPFVAGGAALLLSAEPNLTPSQIQSMMETTAKTEVKNYMFEPANPFEMGSGRVQLAEALKAGLYMNVTGSEFLAANPATGGDPSTLNLPGMVNPNCPGSCSFSRKVSDRVGGGDWLVTAEKFPPAANVTVSPASFSISAGATQNLQIDVDVGPETFGSWVFGEIKLSSDGLPDQHLTVAVFSNAGELPQQWIINSNSDSGWKEFTLSQLLALPNATFASSDLAEPSSTTVKLEEDQTNLEWWDSDQGTMTLWFDVPAGSLRLYTHTPSSTAIDVDLYVGKDNDGDRRVDKSEMICESHSERDIETCDILAPTAGRYWVRAQNWTASTEPGGDDVTLMTALIGPATSSELAASGPGITARNEQFPVRLSWDNVNALPGDDWLGAVSVGSTSEQPDNIGVIPVQYHRIGISSPQTLPLMDGTTHRLALNAQQKHDRIFIDVPSGASSLTIAANGASDEQNNGLTLELVRLDFGAGLSDPPFATPAGSAPVVASASGSGATGPTLTVSGSNLQPGRWYAVLRNDNSDPSALEIRADVEFSGTPIVFQPGLWAPSSRPGLGQGYEYNFSGPNRSLIWYTYDENGQPAWYIAGNVESAGNIWTSALYRVTNDGTDQQLAPVGQVSVTLLAEDDALFSFTLFGESGTERMVPLSLPTCPNISGSEKSYTGLWYRGVDGLGGASVLMNSSTQAQIHYLFDAVGVPRWLFAQDEDQPAPDNPEIPMYQFSGYCAVCNEQTVSSKPVGVLARSFSSEPTGSWTLDYLFSAPLSGSIKRTDQISKLTEKINCE